MWNQPFSREGFGSIECIHKVMQLPLSSSKTFFSTQKETLDPLSSWSPFSPRRLWKPPTCTLSLWIFLFWMFPVNGIMYSFTSLLSACSQGSWMLSSCCQHKSGGLFDDSSLSSEWSLFSFGISCSHVWSSLEGRDGQIEGQERWRCLRGQGPGEQAWGQAIRIWGTFHSLQLHAFPPQDDFSPQPTDLLCI